jgi:hypothetical protein
MGLFTWIFSRRKKPQSFLTLRVSGNGHQAEVSNGVYEIGSPEHNAQIVAALRQVNEQLAPQGKRVPERVAIDVIMSQYEEEEMYYCGLCRCKMPLSHFPH